MATPHDVAACAYGEFIENIADLLNRFDIRPENFKDNDKFLNGVYVAEEKQLSFDEENHKWLGTVYFDNVSGSWQHDVHWYDNPQQAIIPPLIRQVTYILCRGRRYIYLGNELAAYRLITDQPTATLLDLNNAIESGEVEYLSALQVGPTELLF